MKKLFILLLSFSFLLFAPEGNTSAEAFSNKGVLYNLKGQEFRYEDLALPAKAVLFLWTSWCPYCRRELLELNKECNVYPQIDFFYINLGEKKSTVERFIAILNLKECIQKKCLLDPAGFIIDKFSVTGVPAYIFLKNGELVYRTHSMNERILKKVFSDE